MKTLLEFFVRRHLLVNVLAFAMVVLGYIAATSLQREFIPSVDTPILTINAMLPGASARDMETKVTIPIEEALEELEGIDEFTTVVADNTSFTTVELLDDYNHAQIEAAEIELRAALDDGSADIYKKIMLVDPLGNYMMRYPVDLDPKPFLKDIKRLLTVSRIG